MPERFLLQVLSEDGDWVDEAICLARRFERLADGSYICSEFSSGLWIRCIERHQDRIVHVDCGRGAPLVPVPPAPDAPRAMLNATGYVSEATGALPVDSRCVCLSLGPRIDVPEVTRVVRRARCSTAEARPARPEGQ